MTKTFVDGHNAMFALRLRGEDHEACRRKLLARVRERLKNPIVYFDGRGAPRNMPRVFRQEGVKVTYCKDTEADHEILEDVKHEKDVRKILVVTNDRELYGRCKQMGARVARVDEALGDRDEDGSGRDTLPQHRRRRPRVPGVDFDPAQEKGNLGRGDTPLTPADFDLPEIVDPNDPKGI
jgi:hypothetical protein